MRLLVVLFAAAAAAAFLSCANAQTQGTDQQRMACADDYRMLCGVIPPDEGDRILACFRDHRKQLSDACRKIVDGRKK